MILAVTNQDWADEGISYSWDENMLTITHNLNDRVFVQLYDPNNCLCILDLIYIDSNNIAFDFSILNDKDEIIGSIKPADGESYTILISPVSYSVSNESSSSIGEESSSSSSSFSGELPEFPISNPLWEHEYYAGTVADLALFCKSLNIGGGRLAKITDAMVQFYLQKTDDMFDGYLIEYYFLPIRRYNRVLPNGQVESVFPGVVRKAALQISASMLLASEFQNLEPNTNEAVTRYMEEGRKELYAMTLYNQRIPGQRWKSAIGKTFPPTMQPAYTPELTI